MTSSLTIPLANPIEVDGKLIKSIRVRSPTEADVSAVRGLNVGRWLRGLRFISRLTGLPTQAIDEAERLNAAALKEIERFVSARMGW